MWPRASHLVVQPPRAGVVQSRSHGRAEFGPGPLGSAGSQKPNLCPGLGLAPALKEPEAWHHGDHGPARAGQRGLALSEELGWGGSRAGRAKDPEDPSGPIPWSRSAWCPAPHVPRCSPAKLTDPWQEPRWPCCLFAHCPQDSCPRRGQGECHLLRPWD